MKKEVNFEFQNSAPNENVKLHEKYGPKQKPNYSSASLEEIEAKEKKELIGEIIYPLAKRMYSKDAPKLTGMLLDALLKLQNDELIKQAISSKKNIDELVSIIQIIILFQF